jgi:hypothetical protein
LQAFPSSQFVPSVTGTWLICPVAGAHESAVHGLLSSTAIGAPATQVPFASHRSFSVQALPSLHGVVAGRFV